MLLAFHCGQVKIRRSISCLQCHSPNFCSRIPGPFYFATFVMHRPSRQAGAEPAPGTDFRAAHPRIYIAVTLLSTLPANISRMPPQSQEPLTIDDLDGLKPGSRILRLKGPIVLGTLFQFQPAIRANGAK